MNKIKDQHIHIRCFKLSDQIFFAQRLSLLLDSGISIVEALNMMRNIDVSLKRKKIYEILIKNAEKGVSLSKSIKNLALVMDNILIVLIQNGEQGGHISSALSQAYVYLEKKNDMKKKIISSLIYPGFIVIATIAMTFFLILYIFPKIIPLLKSLDIKLPLITRIVQELYYFLISYGIYFGVSMILLVVLLRFIIRKNKFMKYKLHSGILLVPYIHSYIKIYMMISICGMGEMLLSSGKGLPDMIIFSRESSRNIVYKKVFGNIYDESIQGISFSNSLRKYSRYFPPLLIDMCALGERTGSLGSMLGHCTKIFEQDIDNILKRSTSLIEPTLMVFMGLIVGSIALSIILPVYEITNHLSK